jgi:hypothetical protein
VRRVEGPRARERVSNDGCGEAPARWVASDSVFFMPSGGQCGCKSIAALGPAQCWPSSVRWCLPLCSILVADFFFGSIHAGLRVEAAVVFLSPVSALCVVPGRVDDPIRPASEFL